MTVLRIEQLTKNYGARPALQQIDLSLNAGDFLAVLGRSGAGKTSLLKSIAGLIAIDGGRISVGGRDVTHIESGERDVSLLFQNLALFPDRTGFENLAFPLRQTRVREANLRQRVGEVAELLRITHLLERKPASFSGGEAQRVAIGRAIIRPSTLLLLDEPLSNLDARLRLDLRIEFRRLHRELGRTVIYVTHDHVEAMSLGSRIAVLDHGRLLQIGTPADIYDRPVSRTVSELIASPAINFLPVRVAVTTAGRILNGEGFSLAAPHGLSAAAGASLLIGVRPEAMTLARPDKAAKGAAARAQWVEHHGSHVVVGALLGQTLVRVIADPASAIQPNDVVFLQFDAEQHLLLDPATRLFLS